MQKQLLILLVLAVVGLAGTDLRIISVSGSPDTVQTPVYSSLRGGKLVYINAIGHSRNPSQIKVLVGTLPCRLTDEGVSSNYIVCTTSDSGIS